MPQSDPQRIGYVLKRFPRFSETFILNEVLAHEAAGAQVSIHSLRRAPEEPRHARLNLLHASVHVLDRLGRGETARPAPGDEALFEGKSGAEIAALQAKARAVAIRAQAEGITHLHAHFGSDPTTVACLAAREIGGTYSFTAHARDIYHSYVSPEADARMRRAKIRRAAFVVTVSESNAGHLRRLCPEAEARIHRLYNGIDLDYFSPADPASRQPGGIIAVGRMVEKKGFGDLIAACALLRDRGVAFHLTLAGSGPLEGELREAIAWQGLDGRVSLPGPLPQEALRDLMAEAQLAVLPCVVAASGDRDGLPTVLLEAAGRGLPIVTTDVTGGPEIVDHGRTGMVCPPGEPAALAAAIEAVLRDPDRARAMGRAGRVRAERLFDLHRNAARLRQLIATHARPMAGEVA